jgi:drug/metabolite transporter (DMT)-like permease
MLFSVACFTGMVLCVRAMGELHFGNLWLVSCARFIVGLVVIVIFYRREWRPSHLLQTKLIERGLTGGLGVYLTYLAVVKVGSGRAMFINLTYVVWGALLAAWMLREHLRAAVVVGSLIALAGLALLMNMFSATIHPGIYDGVALLSALASAYVVVTIRQLHATEHSSTIFAAQCVYGLVLCAIPALLHPEALSLPAFALMVVTGVFAAVGQLTMTQAFRDLSVAEGSLLQMFLPLGVAAGGFLFYGERLTRIELIGAALIIAGTAVSALRPRRA